MLDYDSMAGSYAELHGKEQLNKLSVIKDNVEISKNAKILDVGCGTGVSSDFECFVVGIDCAFSLLKLNKKEMKIFGVAERLPFKDNSFDYVISVTAIHNFNDTEKSIMEMKRVGKKTFVFSILKKTGKLELIKRIIKQNFNVMGQIEEGKDIIFFCRKLEP